LFGGRELRDRLAFYAYFQPIAFPVMRNVCKRPSLLFIIIVLAAGQCSAREDRSASKAGRIDELVARYAKYGYLNGAVLVAEHGQIIYEKGVGDANIKSHVPNTPRTKFGIASLTKQFTAALVLQQVADGKIRLDGKVSDYLPWYRKDTGEHMTIEQLLHHTGGLPRTSTYPNSETPKRQRGTTSRKRLWKSFASKPS